MSDTFINRTILREKVDYILSNLLTDSDKADWLVWDMVSYLSDEDLEKLLGEYLEDVGICPHCNEIISLEEIK